MVALRAYGSRTPGGDVIDVRYSPKPKEITDEDKVIETYRVNVTPEAVLIMPVDNVFE